MKNIEVLVTTMNTIDYKTLLSNMNINTDAMIGNQCSYNCVETIDYNGKDVKIYSFNEKGVGLNRNNLLMRAEGEICLFGDDDLRYVDNYQKIIDYYFSNLPDADVIIFNLKEKEKRRYIIKKVFRVRAWNFMRFGAARIAIRRKNILLNGILFNICFGGGTAHSHGEDTLFLSDCIKKKLKIYAVPDYIAELTDCRSSTWFEGYNEKYFLDKGLLYYIMSNKLYKVLCFQDAYRHRKQYGNDSFIKNYRIMKKGKFLIKR